jgi:hypothetical protein
MEENQDTMEVTGKDCSRKELMLNSVNADEGLSKNSHTKEVSS